MLQDLDSPMPLKESLVDCKTVKFFGPPTPGEFVEDLKTEVEHLQEERRKNIFLSLGSKGLAVVLKI